MVKINPRYILLLAVAVVATFFFHEAAHWLMGELLGNDMRMNLNAAWPVSGVYAGAWDQVFVNAAGPLFTLLQALVVFIILRRGGSHEWYTALIAPFVMRLLAAGVNVINPNDEGRLSAEAGLGLWTLPVLMVLILFILVYSTSRRHFFTRWFNAANVLLTILFCSLVIMGNQYLVAK